MPLPKGTVDVSLDIPARFSTLKKKNLTDTDVR